MYNQCLISVNVSYSKQTFNDITKVSIQAQEAVKKFGKGEMVTYE